MIKQNISPLAAALLNSSFIQGFELDDWHSEAPLHSNSIILPSLFAAAESLKKKHGEKISGSAFLLAYLVGLEIGPRVGNALYGTQILTRGWHSGAVFGPSASAASTAKMLGLTPNLIEDALGIACTQACGLMSAQFESEVKRMQHGFAARNGLLGTLLARGGYVGIKQVYEQPYGGFLSMFGQGSGKEPEYLLEEVTKGLGQKWQTSNVRCKPYASMAGTHPTVDCIRKLQDEHPAQMKDFENFKDIQLEMADAAYHHGGFEIKRPLTATGAQMSAAYVAATQIVDGQVLPAQFRHDKLDRDEVWKLADKIKCHSSDELSGKFAQRATITLEDGTKLTALVNAAKGVDPPLSNEELVEKWRSITKDVIDDERRAKIEKLCLELDGIDDVMELAHLLAAVTKNPIA